MATKKTTAQKAAQTRKDKQKNEQAQSHARRQIWAIVLFAAGLFLAALAIIEGDLAWRTLHDTLYGLFGFSAILIAPLFIYIAVLATLDKPIGSISSKVWQSMVIIVLISCTVQIFSYGPLRQRGLWNCLVEIFQGGVLLNGGGLSSALIAVPLMALCGQGGAKIVIVLLLFVFVMIFTGGTLIGLWRSAAKPVKKLGETYTQRIQELEEAPVPETAAPSAAVPPRKGKPRFNVDVPLDAAAPPSTPAPSRAEKPDPPMPAHPVQFEGDVPQGSFARQTLERLEQQDRGRDALFAAARPVGRFEFDVPLEQPVSPGDIPTGALPPEPDLVDIEAGSGTVLKFRSAPAEPVQCAPEELAFEPAPEPALVSANGAAEDLAPLFPAPHDTAPVPATHRALTTDEVIDEILRRSAQNDRAAAPPSQTAAPASTADAVPAPNPEPARGTLEDKLGASIADALAEHGGAAPAFTAKGTPNERFSEEFGKPQEYVHPPVTLLNLPAVRQDEDSTEELKANAQRLVDTLKSFGVQTRIIDIAKGPAVTRYELQPSAGVKISKITSLADDIALNLAAAGVRIEAPIPNKPAVGIEVPNRNISTVHIREIIDSSEFVDSKSALTMSLGRDISGRVTVGDIAKMPHMLIAGATGSGKSVCINSIIISILYKASPDEVKLLMVDPKVVELGIYNGIPHLLVPVVTDPKKAAGALSWAVSEMLNRYKLFADNAVRDITGFNRLCQSNPELKYMPRIVIIVDELADLMMAAPNDVEDYICRLAQMARAAGMHLVIATQRPSVDVITGVIKANIPSRIAFAVSSAVDSRTILDQGGAEKLLGRGDMLFYPVGSAKPMRVQGCFVTDSEVESVVDFIKRGGEVADYDQSVMDEIDRQAVSEKSKGGKDDGGGFNDEDDMLPAAIECVIEMGQASTSMLQRKLKLGYARAARIVDQLEEKGIVGPFEGAKPRQVLITRDQWYEMKLRQEN